MPNAEPRPPLIHGTALALGRAAALIRGSSGSGKSDLALRCLGVAPGGLITTAAGLVADDQVIIRLGGGDAAGTRHLIASAPATLFGRLEVRGIGIVAVPAVVEARLVLVVDLVPPAAVERMPEPQQCEIHGVVLPRLELAPFEASSALKLLLHLQNCAREAGSCDTGL